VARRPGSAAVPSVSVQQTSSPLARELSQPTTPRRQHPTTRKSGSLSPAPTCRTQQAVSPARTPRPPRVRVASPSPPRPCCTPQVAWGMIHGGTSLGDLPPGGVRCDVGAGQRWHMTTCAFAGSTEIPITLSPGGRSDASSASSPSPFPPSTLEGSRPSTLEDRLTAMRRACDEAAARLKTQPGLSPLRPVPEDMYKIEIPSVLPVTPPRRRVISVSPVRRWQSQPPLPASVGCSGAVSAQQSSINLPDSPRHGSCQRSTSEASTPRDGQEDELSPVPSIECYVKADTLRKQLDVIEGKRRGGRDSKRKVPQLRRSR